MKYVVFLGDGMADEPVEALKGKTPLEAAKHPVMDRLAANGLFGLVRTVPEGMIPGSDTANLSVFGYDPRECYSGRSPLEAASIGVPLTEEDVTYRMNFVTLSGDPDDPNSVMRDYSAGEITSEEALPLVKKLNERFQSDALRIYPGFSYRNCLVLSHAADGGTQTPPHDIYGQTVADKLPKGTNADILKEMIRYSWRVLGDEPANRARAAAGKNPANAVWFWGEGRKPRLSPFTERFGISGAVVSAVDLVQGIGVCAGLRVVKAPGATGNYHTDFASKGRVAIDALKSGSDFVYIHVEAPDECGHHGELPEKIFSIEQIDEKIMAPVMEYLDGSGEDYAVLVMPDHPTPLAIRTHTSTPVPFALYRKGDCSERAVHYCERTAKETGVFVPKAHRLLPHMIDPASRLFD